MCYVEGKAFDRFVRPQGYTQCVLVRNTEYKQLLFVYKRNPWGPFKVGELVGLWGHSEFILENLVEPSQRRNNK